VSGANEPQPPESPEASDTPSRARGRKRRALKRWTRRLLEIGAALVAAAVVAIFTVDLVDIARVFGIDLIEMAEREGSRALESRLRIGDISANITPGDFVVSNLVIEGREPGDRPFIAAERIAVHVDWSALWRNEIVLEVTMTDWDMVIERWADGRHNVPRLRFGGGGALSAGPTCTRWAAGSPTTTMARRGASWRQTSTSTSCATPRSAGTTAPRTFATAASRF
jgi:hypothetical protein